MLIPPHLHDNTTSCVITLGKFVYRCYCLRGREGFAVYSQTSPTSFILFTHSAIVTVISRDGDVYTILDPHSFYGDNTFMFYFPGCESRF